MKESPEQESPGVVFARRLRQKRSAAGMSQADLAKQVSRELGTSFDATAVTRIERHARSVKVEEAVALAKGLGVDVGALLNDLTVEHRLVQQRAAVTRAEENVAAARAALLEAQDELSRRVADLRAFRTAVFGPEHSEHRN